MSRLIKLTDSQNQFLKDLAFLECDQPGEVGVAYNRKMVSDGNTLLRHGMAIRFKFDDGVIGFRATQKGLVAACVKWPEEFFIELAEEHPA